MEAKNDSVYADALENEAARVFAGGEHLLILTPSGRLYGLLDNTHGAICKGGEKHYETPFLMAEQVISAAASAHCSIYVTGDSQVHLLGTGEMADRFSGFQGAARVYAGLMRDTFWIEDTQGKLFCFGENGPGGSLQPWKKTLLETLPEETCVVTYYWGSSDIQALTDAIQKRLEQSAAFLRRRAELGSRNICLELENTGSRVLEGKRKYHQNRREQHTFLPKIYYLNNYYAAPFPYPDQRFAETPHRQGCEPLSDGLCRKISMHEGVKKAVHIRGYDNFLLLLTDGRTALADSRGNVLWENIFAEPVSDLSWGHTHMIVSFRSGGLAMTDAHTAFLRNLKTIHLPAKVEAAADQDAAAAQPVRVFGGASHFLILEKGKLYGLGSNQNCQISNSQIDDRSPHLIARNVVSAAAGKTLTIYVTSDGKVTLQGNSEITERFPGFANAKAVYAAQDNDRFYIEDREGNVFVFGSNTDCRIAQEDCRFILDFTDEMILEAYNRFGSHYDRRAYVKERSDEERAYWKNTLTQTDAYRNAVKKYGKNNISLKHLNLYHPYHVYDPSLGFRRDIIAPSLYLTNRYVYEPIPLEEERAKMITHPLPFYSGCEPYELLPQGYEAAVMHRNMPDAVKVIFNERLNGLVLRKNKDIAVHNSWTGAMYEPYPEVHQVCDIALDGGEKCLIAFESGEYYYGSIEALKAFSPRKRKVLPLRILEDGEFRYTNDAFLFDNWMDFPY